MILLLNQINAAVNSHADLFIAQGLSPVAHIDKYRGQTGLPENFTGYELPALFIDFKTKWQKAGKAYNGEVAVSFYLVTQASWANGNYNMTLTESIRDEKYYGILRSIIDDLETDETGKLKRIAESSIESELINCRIFEYSCIYYDPAQSGTNWEEAAVQKLKVEGH